MKRALIAVPVLALALTACGGGGSGDKGSSAILGPIPTGLNCMSGPLAGVDITALIPTTQPDSGDLADDTDSCTWRTSGDMTTDGGHDESDHLVVTALASAPKTLADFKTQNKLTDADFAAEKQTYGQNYAASVNFGAHPESFVPFTANGWTYGFQSVTIVGRTSTSPDSNHLGIVALYSVDKNGHGFACEWSPYSNYYTTQGGQGAKDAVQTLLTGTIEPKKDTVVKVCTDLLKAARSQS